jgi:hypothetical protein
MLDLASAWRRVCRSELYTALVGTHSTFSYGQIVSSQHNITRLSY